jgi:hypothetical protein
MAAEAAPPPANERAPLDVAVGVLIDGQGRFLLTSRPAGKEPSPNMKNAPEP